MRALVLAAGYGTRLYPLTRDRPKPLLPVGGRPVLDHLARDLGELETLEEVRVVTNARFVEELREWAEAARRDLPVPLRVISDGTRRPEERLGAVGDIAFAVERMESDGDLLVVAGDNLFEFDLSGMTAAAREAPGADALVAVEERLSPERLRRGGVAEVDPEGRIRQFREKPDEPATATAAAPLHLYRGRVLPLFGRYVEEGRDPDAPGHFLEWLVPRRDVRAWRMPGPRRDIGTPEAYLRARERYGSPGEGGDEPQPADGWP